MKRSFSKQGKFDQKSHAGCIDFSQAFLKTIKYESRKQINFPDLKNIEFPKYRDLVFQVNLTFKKINKKAK